MRAGFIFAVVFAAALFATHASLLALPFHWDELGYFVPAALDILHKGAWVPVSTEPNVHPPLIMALLAGVWKVFGYSIASARITMLLIASAGVLFSFLLAIRLCRGLRGTPAFAAVLFLLATPLFYTQSMMAMLDMPVMTLSTLALLLFLDGRTRWCAAVCVALVLTKETAVTAPLVFGGWLLYRRGAKEGLRDAAPFLLSLAVLGGWLVYLHAHTGHWFGSATFAQYNVGDSLRPLHILGGIARRFWYLFIADGRLLGTAALFFGRRVFFRSPVPATNARKKHASGPGDAAPQEALLDDTWRVAGLVAIAQIAAVTILGGAQLERYLLPVFPIFYAAVAAAASSYSPLWQRASHGAMVACLALGWVWYPPYPFPVENNLAMLDFVHLQQDLGAYLEVSAPNATVATSWPLSDALTHPEFGYVHKPVQVVRTSGLHLTDIAGADLRGVSTIAVYTQRFPYEGSAIDFPWLRGWLRSNFDYQPQANPEEIQAGLGFIPILTWERRGQWMRIYAKP